MKADSSYVAFTRDSHIRWTSLYRRQATSPSMTVPFDAGVIKVGL